MKINKTVWIGLAEVEPQNGTDILGENSKGAYVNVLALANNRESFRRQIKKACCELDLKLIRLEDCELFEIRIKKGNVDKEIVKKAKEVREMLQVRFATFHTWAED